MKTETRTDDSLCAEQSVVHGIQLTLAATEGTSLFVVSLINFAVPDKTDHSTPLAVCFRRSSDTRRYMGNVDTK